MRRYSKDFQLDSPAEAVIALGNSLAKFSKMHSCDHLTENLTKLLKDVAARIAIREEAESASQAEAIAANVIQAVNIINAISEANQDAKNQITLESQRAQADIKVAVANDDCARQPVPAAVADRLRQFADSLRTGSGSAAAGKPDH